MDDEPLPKPEDKPALRGLPRSEHNPGAAAPHEAAGPQEVVEDLRSTLDRLLTRLRTGFGATGRVVRIYPEETPPPSPAAHPGEHPRRTRSPRGRGRA